MEELQEKSLQREGTKADATPLRLPFGELDPELQLAIRCADDKKAARMSVLDLRRIVSFTEFFMIADGANQRQVQAIADDLDAGPDDIRPRIVAAAVMAAFTAVHDPSASPEPPKSQEEAIAKIDDVMGFLRGGLEALRDR